MKRLLSNLFVASGTAGAAAAVLTKIESLLRSPVRQTEPPVGQSGVEPPASEALPVNAAAADVATLAPKADPERNFSIKRTKSEVGYVYWILEGYGKYKCFVLCDTWDEAVAKAKARLAEVDAEGSAGQAETQSPILASSPPRA